MKNTRFIKNILGLGAILAFTLGLGSSAYAGPGIQYWNHATSITTMRDVDALKPGDTVMMVCGACKTVTLTEYKSSNSNGRPPLRWMEIGSTHTCEHCGGTITVVQGKTTNSMQHNCSKCGEGAAFCCVVKGDDKGAQK